LMINIRYVIVCEGVVRGVVCVDGGRVRIVELKICVSIFSTAFI